MKTNFKEVQVAGKKFTVYADFVKRGCFAVDENGVEKQISFSGYVSNELSVRKAIALVFELSTFRKNAPKNK